MRNPASPVRIRRLDLQAKISLVLFSVIVPTFVIVTVAENQFTQPVLEEELRQVGVNAGKTLANEILSERWLSLPDPGPTIERAIQEVSYAQPNLLRIDVVAKDAKGVVKTIASNIEEDPGTAPPEFALVESITSEFKTDDHVGGYWDISVPIEAKAGRKLLGTVHVMVSTKLVKRVVGTLWRTTVIAAILSMITLFVVLTYFLRKTIANDRALRKAETENLVLTEQLHDAQRQIMNKEKLAVMGQLTASFAHEIGTPLNAVGGHLQLLAGELRESDLPPALREKTEERIGVVQGQLDRIAGIVKGFLQSTAKPPSQTQLVDLNRLVDKTLGIVAPRAEALGVEVRKHWDEHLGPVRAVPLDLEQIFLNLLNNSLDSLQSKKTNAGGHPRLALEVSTERQKLRGKSWVRISVHDTGEGIPKEDLPRVLKPFYTTKPPGQGTGLGLTICEQLAHKHGGELEVDSKQNAWTRVSLKLPYG